MYSDCDHLIPWLRSRATAEKAKAADKAKVVVKPTKLQLADYLEPEPLFLCPIQPAVGRRGR